VPVLWLFFPTVETSFSESCISPFLMAKILFDYCLYIEKVILFLLLYWSWTPAGVKVGQNAVLGPTNLAICLLGPKRAIILAGTHVLRCTGMSYQHFAVLNIVNYNNKRVTFTLPVVFFFCLISLLFWHANLYHMLKTRYRQRFRGVCQKSRGLGGPENIVTFPGNFIVPLPFNFCLNAWTTVSILFIT